MNDSPLQLALRELRGALSSRITLVGMLLAIVVLTVAGPFDTFASFNIGQRLAYWAAMVVLSYLTGQGVSALLLNLLRGRIAQKWPRVIVTALLTALPVTVIVFLVNGIAHQNFGAADILPLWLYATMVTLVIIVTLVALTDRLRAAATAATATPVAAPQPPPILERVPLPQRGRLLALSVEDHYVDVVTDRGKTLVLMRLADAMREASGVEGLQIHRSHWVARGAVVKTHRVDGRVVLELSNGLRLPVSRGYLPAVRTAGLG